MHLSMLRLRGGGGGGGYPREFDSATFSLGRVFDTWAPPLGREFDMAAILEGRENLEMRRRERKKGKQICFICSYVLAIASFKSILVF